MENQPTFCSKLLIQKTLNSRIMSDGRFQKRKNSNKYKTFKGNKQEGQGFADKRKRKIKHEYLKVLKKQKQQGKGPVTMTYDSDNDTELSQLQSSSKRSGKNNNANRYIGSQLEFKKNKKEKEFRRQEFFKKKKEKEAAIDKYNKEKQKRHKKLCKKTYKGQPVMKNQIEFLLEKIQKQVNQT